MAVEDLYSNLNQLLEDICKFLTEKSNYDLLSPQARTKADELIVRSKQQLQEIGKVAVLDDYNGAYVDMERKPDNEDDKNNIYSSVDEPVVSPKIEQIMPQCPYADLPAKELMQGIKYGPLSWKTKFILFDKMRRIYGGIHNNWLLIYSNEKDLKPVQSFHLKFHRAKNVQTKQGKNLPHDFELICTSEEKKTYYFTALTPKDMLQWISHINTHYETLNSTCVTVKAPKDTGEVLDKTIDPEGSSDEEAIYHDIEPLIDVAPEQNNSNNPPDLPSRRPMGKLIPNSDAESGANSVVSIVEVASSSLESVNSFSEEEEEDDIYESFVTVNAKLTPKRLVFAKPPIIKEKPRTFSNLKKL